MIEVSQKYKDTMVAGLRNFNADIEITLSNGVTLPSITNAQLRSFSVDDAVSDDNKFTMLGSAIINQCVFALDNMSDIYYDYNFFDAEVIAHINCTLLDGTIERIRKGTYFVEDYKYLDGIIELTCYDNLAKFDRPYSLSALGYPTTVQNIITDACNICGVTLSDKLIPNNDLIIPNGPLSDNATFREVLSKVGQIIGCYVKCDTFGRLEFGWCNVDALNEVGGSLDGGLFDSDTPYSTGDVADGGLFNPWNIGYVLASATFALQNEAHNLYYNYSQEVAVVDTVITGVSVTTTPILVTDVSYKLGFAIRSDWLILQKSDDIQTTFAINDKGELLVTIYSGTDKFYINKNVTDGDVGALIVETENSLELDTDDTAPKTFSAGQLGFVISIENNELMDEHLAELVSIQLSKQLIGMRFRKASTYHMNDPTIESGDVALLWDRKNRSYPIIITHTTFKIGGQQLSICGSETAVSNSAVRQTETSRIYNSMSNTVQLGVNSINSKLDSFPGLYYTIDNGAYFIHNRTSIKKSSIVWRMTPQTITVSQDGGSTWIDGLSLRYLTGKATISKDGSYRVNFTGMNTSNVTLPAFNTTNMYKVFLQKYGQGDLWVDRITATYFTVKGTANLSFCWEIKW